MKYGIRRLKYQNFDLILMWHQEVEIFGGTEMLFGGTEMVLGVRKWFGGTEMVFNHYKSQPPDAFFHYFDIVVGNAY